MVHRDFFVECVFHAGKVACSGSGGKVAGTAAAVAASLSMEHVL
jgi:hypothetical protein